MSHPALSLLFAAALCGCGDSSSSSDGAVSPDGPTPGRDLATSRDSSSSSDGALPPGPDGGGGGGIASLHCGDTGIESDPDVVFVEKFDEGSISAAQANWDSVDSPGNMTIVSMVPPGSGAQTAAKWHYESTDALTVGFVKQLAGYDQLYFRYYIYIPQAADPIWHFSRLGGGSPFGGANQKPDGTDRFVTSLEPNYDRWKWDFYTYWVDMRPDSAGDFYGNNFLGEDFTPCKDVAPDVARDQWVALEFLVKLNTVGQYDGGQSFWIDGATVTSSYSGGGAPQVVSDIGPGKPLGEWITAHFCPDTAGMPFDGASGTPGNGMRWRTDGSLQLSYARPMVYNDHAQPNPANDAYIANLVVAKSYIGPIEACH